MFPSSFDYQRANSVQEALALLSQHPDAKLIAGGHSLLPAMKLRLATPPMLIDISKIDDFTMNAVSPTRDGGTLIGALATHAKIAGGQFVPFALQTAASLIGDMQVRNMGTIGGSIAHADPAADYPAVLLALGAEIHVEGPNGARVIAADDFFTDLFTTALQPNEIVVSIRIRPAGTRAASAYAKHPHPASGFAVAGVAVAIAANPDRTVSTARVAVTGACAKAQRLSATENALMGKPLNADNIQAAAMTDNMLDCLSDQYASAEYRAHLSRILARNALTTVLERMQ